MIKLRLEENDLLVAIHEETNEEQGIFKLLYKGDVVVNNLLNLELIVVADNENDPLTYFSKLTQLGLQVVNGEVECSVEGSVYDKNATEETNSKKEVQKVEERGFEFERNIPVPVIRRNSASKFDNIPLEKMELNQSFTLPVLPSKKARTNLAQSLKNYCKRKGITYDFAVRMVDGNDALARVWRIA